VALRRSIRRLASTTHNHVAVSALGAGAPLALPELRQPLVKGSQASRARTLGGVVCHEQVLEKGDNEVGLYSVEDKTLSLTKLTIED
jgi:hypothetical protein